MPDSEMRDAHDPLGDDQERQGMPMFKALLLTAKFDFGKTRLHLTRDNSRFTAKIALVDRIQWFPGATTGTEDHCWLVWAPLSAGPQVPRLLYEGKRA